MRRVRPARRTARTGSATPSTTRTTPTTATTPPAAPSTDQTSRASPDDHQRGVDGARSLVGRWPEDLVDQDVEIVAALARLGVERAEGAGAAGDEQESPLRGVCIGIGDDGLVIGLHAPEDDRRHDSLQGGARRPA
jgi:hypothetical protein